MSYGAFTSESSWTVIDTEGKHYSVQAISEKFPGVGFYADYNKLNIGPVPMEMNGYKVRCTFTGPGGSVDSGYAEIIIEDPNAAAQDAAAPAAGPAHEHVFSDQLSSDAGYHWYGCECGETRERQAHRYTWTQRRAATLDAPGLVQGECSVCGYAVNARTQLDPAEAEKLRAEAAAAATPSPTPSPVPTPSPTPAAEARGLMGLLGSLFS